MTDIKVYITKTEYMEAAKSLATKLGNSVIEGEPSGELSLFFSEEGLCLCENGLKMKGDFSELLERVKPGRLQTEMLVKACTLKNDKGENRVIDATAGLGEDSFILAAAGFDVTLFEYDVIIAALLRDAIERGKSDKKLSHIVSRMHLIEGDSIEYLKKLKEPPSVVLLDPMFPKRQKSGLIKKKFQLLQKLESPCGNEEDLLLAAKEAKPIRIVIKRPKKGPYLANEKPSFSYEGKAIRYDCLVNIR